MRRHINSAETRIGDSFFDEDVLYERTNNLIGIAAAYNDEGGATGTEKAQPRHIVDQMNIWVGVRLRRIMRRNLFDVLIDIAKPEAELTSDR